MRSSEAIANVPAHLRAHLERRQQEPTVRPVFLFDTEAKAVAEEAVKALRNRVDGTASRLEPAAVMGDGVWFPAVLVHGREAQVRCDVHGAPREVHFIGPNDIGANIPAGHRWSIDLVTGIVTAEHW